MKWPMTPLFRRLIASTLFAGLIVLWVTVQAAVAQRRSDKDQGDWKAPARAARKANPVTADAASLKAGRKVYVAECLDCHGSRGAGDGPGVKDLKSKVPTLADADVWRQSDGELFWKLSTGRGDMPGFDDMLSEEERWHVLNYARATFAPRDGTDERASVATQRQRSEGKR